MDEIPKDIRVTERIFKKIKQYAVFKENHLIKKHVKTKSEKG